MKHMKSLLLGAALSTAALFGYGADKQEIRFIPYYDSLAKYVGQAGHWFVRDAAGSTTGQHGDPTVMKGWAIYTWNPRRADGKAGWTKICEEESMDSSVAEQLLAKYLSKAEFESIIKNYVTAEKHATDIASIMSMLDTMDDKIDQANTNANLAIAMILAHEVWAKNAISNAVVVASNYTDKVAVDTLKAANDYTDEATNALAKTVSANEYSAYEVWPHASEDNLMERFYVRTTVAELKTVTCSDGEIDIAVPKASNNCYVDWGDGARTYLRDLPDFSTMTTNMAATLYRKSEWISEMDWVTFVVVQHTYAASNDRKYIVKVGGKDFFCIYHQTLDATYPMNSLMCRVFAEDLPIAHNHNNYCTFAANSPYLTSVHFPHGFDTPWVKNWSSIFVGCKNLKEVLNMDCASRNAKDVGSIFSGCTALTNTDFRISGHNVYAPSRIFYNCNNLEVDLLKLLPSNGFADQSVDLSSCFNGCKKLYIGATSSNKVAQILWCNNLVQWTSSGCFANCSASLRSVIPTTWGGTAQDIISSKAKGATVINNYPSLPNRVNGPFNVALGVDNDVGFGGNSSSYSVAIGTSNEATKMHSYAWGSQLNSLNDNTTTLGYGLTATDQFSVVIGQASRSIADRTFANEAKMIEFFSNESCKNEVFVGYGVLCDNGPGCSHIVTAVLENPDASTGMYVTLKSGPYDIEVGKRKWFYGKSHGRGTVNLVAIGDGVTDYGMANVYINDRSLCSWTGINIGQKTYKEQFNKGLAGPTNVCEHDYTIAIGDNARAMETATSCQSIAIGRDALAAGTAQVAVGPNAFAYNTMGVAVGWRANAVGLHAVSIGAAKQANQDYFVGGVINPNSDLALAEGDESIQIGYNGKARGLRSAAIGYYAAVTGSDSIQLGFGTNTTSKTLRFLDVDIVKEGKLVGAGGSDFKPADLDPKILDISTNEVEEGEFIVKVYPHVVNTLTATKECGPDSELYLEPTGSRNYKIYIPNTDTLRAGLPISIETEITPKPTMIFTEGTKWVHTLPAMIEVQQPITNNLLFSNKNLNDGWDWKPVITNCNIVCTNVTTSAKFVTQGSYSLLGKNLHSAVKYQLVYPISATAVCTNELMEATSEGFIVGTLYSTISSVELEPPQPIYFSGAKSWFEIIYKTNHGDADVIHKEIDL